MSIRFNIHLNFGKNRASDRGAAQDGQRPAAAVSEQRTKRRAQDARAGKADGDYVAWILLHLPKDLPPCALAAAERLDGWVRGLEFWVPGDRGPDYAFYTAKTETEMQYWLFKEACVRAARALEIRSRSGDELRYRYVMDHAENGRWIYRQNRGYAYNTIHDSRKAWMEQALRMALPILPPREGEAFAAEYERLLNNHYRTPHWGYDREQGAFREISDSPWVDWNGVEQPAPGTVIGVDHL